MTDWSKVTGSQVPRVCAVCRFVVDRGERHAKCAACGRGRACDDRGWHVCGAGVRGCGPYCPECAAAGKTKHSHV